MSEKFNVILASQSPRRKELLRLITEDFSVITADVDETVDPALEAHETVMNLALKKAIAVAESNKESLVIGADTVVVLDGEILGKPKNREHAYKMLKSLSGNTHKVLTGVCIALGDTVKTFYVSSNVKFYDLTDEEINEYIATGEPDDKAGAYGIQGKGSLLVEKIDGDYFNIVGLPIAELNKELKIVSRHIK